MVVNGAMSTPSPVPSGVPHTDDLSHVIYIF